MEEVEQAEFKDLEFVDSFYDTEDHDIETLVIKFEGTFYRIILEFNSYSAEFEYDEVEWKDFEEVKAVTKEIIVYQ